MLQATMPTRKTALFRAPDRHHAFGREGNGLTPRFSCRVRGTYSRARANATRTPPRLGGSAHERLERRFFADRIEVGVTPGERTEPL